MRKPKSYSGAWCAPWSCRPRQTTKNTCARKSFTPGSCSATGAARVRSTGCGRRAKPQPRNKCPEPGLAAQRIVGGVDINGSNWQLAHLAGEFQVVQSFLVFTQPQMDQRKAGGRHSPDLAHRM